MIYLDYNATTPCDPRVVDAMLPYFTVEFGNPDSDVHSYGRTASRAVNQARAHVAELINARPHEIVFTSGATESNNLAIVGALRALSLAGSRIVTTKIEHKSVLESFGEAAVLGYECFFLDVDENGRVDLDAAREIITGDTILVSIQAANNEIGTTQDIRALASVAHDRGALFHCDAAQAVGKMDVDVDKWDVDLLSFSGHKVYGPKGVGVLYIKGGPRQFPLMPLMRGGGQEHGLRPGTLNVPAVVGLGEACRLLVDCWRSEAKRVAELRDQFESSVVKCFPAIRRGDPNNRLPGTTSLTFPEIDSEALIVNTPQIAWSIGSACNSGALEPSHVLLAIGLDRTTAYQTIRVGIGRFTTEAEIDMAVQHISDAIDRLKQLIK